MTDIVQFLTDRYAEEQQLAEAATPGVWVVGGESLAPYLPRDFVHAPHYKPEGFSQGQNVGDASVADGGMGPWAVSVRGSGFPFANAQHIAAHDPARVLADIAAKRLLFALHEPQADVRIRDGKYVQDPPKCTICFMPYPRRGTSELWPCPTVRLLAAPFASHPDFKPGWRIDG